MTNHDTPIVLVTAWNDSGAGRFMRLMDGADHIFAFPFELLLGADTTAGIHYEPNLVSGKYRWNLFREDQQIQAALKQKQSNNLKLEPCESELKEWLAARKFNSLAEYRAQAQAFIDRTKIQSLSKKQLLQSGDIIEYINGMKAIFTDRDSHVNLIHTPCAALDWGNQKFMQIFDKVISIVIDPIWGFGNMHARNKITAYRYLERWHQINQASFLLKQQHPGKVLILHSSINADRQAENVKKCHEFIGVSTVSSITKYPTLLGRDIGETGFPYGGISKWSIEAYQSSLDLANTELSKANNHTVGLLANCKSLYKLLMP